MRPDHGHRQPDQEGTIKGYAATTKDRLALLPELPTLDEAGLKDFEVSPGTGSRPRRARRGMRDKLAAALQAAFKDARVIERFARLATVPVSPEQPPRRR